MLYEVITVAGPLSLGNRRAERGGTQGDANPHLERISRAMMGNAQIKDGGDQGSVGDGDARKPLYMIDQFEARGSDAGNPTHRRAIA